MENENVIVPLEVLNKVFNTLAQLPYSQVAALMQELQAGVKTLDGGSIERATTEDTAEG